MTSAFARNASSNPHLSSHTELLWAYGPCGQEDAVRAVCARELRPLVDGMWTDDAGNLVGYIGAADGSGNDAAVHGHRHRSASTAGPRTATRVMAHGL
jgi:hypothetical protein